MEYRDSLKNRWKTDALSHLNSIDSRGSAKGNENESVRNRGTEIGRKRLLGAYWTW